MKVRRGSLRVSAQACALLVFLLCFDIGAPLAYEEAGHFYTIGIVMNELDRPMPPADANLITFCAWLPDETSELNAVAVYSNLPWMDWLQFAGQNKGPITTVGAMVAVQELLHGLTAGDADAVTRVARHITIDLKNVVDTKEASGIRPDPEDFCALGFALHLYGDSYAHRDIYHAKVMYPTGRGHAYHFTHPDHPLLSGPREELWEGYVRQVAPDVEQGNNGRDLNNVFKEVENYYSSHPNDGNDNEAQLTSLLSSWLGRLSDGHAPHFTKGTGGFFSGEPCRQYVDENFASGKPKPNCIETWNRYRKYASKWFTQEKRSRGDSYVYTQFDKAEPRWP